MNEDHYLNILSSQIKFQRYWKNLTLAFYVCMSVGAIVCTSAASLLAALKYATPAAIIAAVATIFVTLETTFSFKEKWKHHMSILTDLLNIELELELQDHTKEEIIEKLMKVQLRYAAELPVLDKKH